MQLLVKYEVSDPEAWKRDYDRHAEARGGMQQLQLWREGATTVWGLYEIEKPGAASDFLDGVGKLDGTIAERHELKTF